jgi:hypothetical protein
MAAPMSVIHESRLVAYVFGTYRVGTHRHADADGEPGGEGRRDVRNVPGSFRCGDFSVAGRIVYLRLSCGIRHSLSVTM